jgi:septin 7
MEELREHTNLVLSENYRTHKLQLSSDSVTATPFTKIEEERRAHEAKMAKMEQEMRLVFSQKVAEKEAKLKQSEDELYGKHKEVCCFASVFLERNDLLTPSPHFCR